MACRPNRLNGIGGLDGLDGIDGLNGIDGPPAGLDGHDGLDGLAPRVLAASRSNCRLYATLCDNLLSLDNLPRVQRFSQRALFAS